VEEANQTDRIYRMKPGKPFGKEAFKRKEKVE